MKLSKENFNWRSVGGLVLGGIVVLMVGVGIGGRRNISVNDKKITVIPTIIPVGENCSGIRLHNLIGGWRADVVADSGNVKYVEYNIKENKICKYNVFEYLPRLGEKVENFNLSPFVFEQKASFIFGDKEKNNWLIIVDLRTKEVKQIPLLGTQLDFQVWYGGYEYGSDERLLGTFIVVSPVTFVGGCESPESCKSFERAVEADRNRDDVWVTIARTDGEYVRVKRNDFPRDTDFGKFEVKDGKIIFMRVANAVAKEVILALE